MGNNAQSSIGSTLDKLGYPSHHPQIVSQILLGAARLGKTQTAQYLLFNLLRPLDTPGAEDGGRGGGSHPNAEGTESRPPALTDASERRKGCLVAALIHCPPGSHFSPGGLSDPPPQSSYLPHHLMVDVTPAEGKGRGWRVCFPDRPPLSFLPPPQPPQLLLCERSWAIRSLLPKTVRPDSLMPSPPPSIRQQRLSSSVRKCPTDPLQNAADLAFLYYFPNSTCLLGTDKWDVCLLTELMAGAGRSYLAKKCGIRLQPPSIILIYEDKLKSNMRKRIMPVRNFSKFSDCSRAAEQLKNNPRHKIYLEGVSLEQLQKLYHLLRYHLEGQSLTESLEAVQQEKKVDPEEDLNKLDDDELAKRKRIMDELFEKNRKKKEDPDFVYNVEVTFPQDEELEACEWDTESDEEF